MMKFALAASALALGASAASATAFDFEAQALGAYPSLTVSDPGIDLTVTADNTPGGFVYVYAYSGVGTRGVIASKTALLAVGNFAPIRFTFSHALDSVTFLFGDGGGDGDNPLTISAYSAGGILLGNATTTSADGFNTPQSLTLNFAGSSYFVASSLSGGGSGILNDNSLAYDVTAYTLSGSSAAPEPASWALMLGGFGAIGGAMRGRRKAAISFG